jgi:hypothetical protein
MGLLVVSVRAGIRRKPAHEQSTGPVFFKRTLPKYLDRIEYQTPSSYSFLVDGKEMQ